MTTLVADSWATGHPKGTYYLVNTTAMQRSIRIACPGCGQIHDMTEGYVSPEGVVTPPVQCACGFTDQVQLRGWTEPNLQVSTASRPIAPR